MIELAPSILAADFARLAEQAQQAIAGGGSVLHVDVMDGHFVPNLTVGPAVVACLRKALEPPVPLDVHLMIEEPERYVEAFAKAGAGWISVHREVCTDLGAMLRRIRGLGCRAGVVLNPETGVEGLEEILPLADYVLVMSVQPGFGGQSFLPGSLDKLRRLSELRKKLGLSFRLEVDGGITPETLPQAVAAGAEILVAGSAVFSHGEIAANARNLLRLAQQTTVV